MQQPIFGKITRSLSDVWYQAGGAVPTLPCAHSLFLTTGLYPTKAQVCEMLHVARECSAAPRAPASPTPPSDRTLLTFGEFCLFSTDLQKGYSKQNCTTPSSSASSGRLPLTRQCSATAPTITSSSSDRHSKHNNHSSPSSSCQVFLGGSCNPTTWRKEIAIPMLNELGITYYNPQVTNWEEALVEREHKAKTTASVLFFVFDRSTRNVASMVEVAYIAARKRKIMLVLDTYPHSGHHIGGEPMSKREYEELSGGLNTVQDLVERRGIPVFSQIRHALQCTAKIINEDLWPQQLGTDDNVTPVRNTHLQPAGETYSKIQAAFSGRSLSLEEAQRVFSDITGRRMTPEELLTVVAAKRGVSSVSVSSELPFKEVFVNADEFCCIVAEFTCPTLEQRKRSTIFTNSLMSSLQKAFAGSPRRSPRLHQKGQSYLSVLLPNVDQQEHYRHCRYDIYLGGVRDHTQSWQDDIAIPLLKKKGLSFCVAGESLPKSPISLSPNKSPESSSMVLTNGSDVVASKTRDDQVQNHHEFSIPSIDVSDVTNWDTESRGRLFPSEAASIDQCKVLLFVVTSNTRGVSTMTLASHYIGLGCNVVLCIQKIPDNAVVDGEQLTKAAIKDYNRGRSYLTDQAKKDSVPVTTDIEEAVQCAIMRCKQTR